MADGFAAGDTQRMTQREEAEESGLEAAELNVGSLSSVLQEIQNAVEASQNFSSQVEYGEGGLRDVERAGRLVESSFFSSADGKLKEPKFGRRKKKPQHAQRQEQLRSDKPQRQNSDVYSVINQAEAKLEIDKWNSGGSFREPDEAQKWTSDEFTALVKLQIRDQIRNERNMERAGKNSQLAPQQGEPERSASEATSAVQNAAACTK